MMAFQIVRGGFLAMFTPDECELLAGLVRDVVYILGSDVDDELARAKERENYLALDGFAGGDERSDRADSSASQRSEHNEGDASSFMHSSALEEDYFAALEDEFAAIEERVQIEAEDVGYPFLEAPAQQDDALARLLPDMSEDPDEANELRDLTEESISLAKVENLMLLYRVMQAVKDDETEDSRLFGSKYIQRKLRNNQRPYDRDAVGDKSELLRDHRDVLISNEDAPRWLAALNDIRLVLATRLKIDDEEMNNSVYERSTRFTSQSLERSDDSDEIESPEDMMAVLYAMLSWLQETLLIAVSNKALRR